MKTITIYRTGEREMRSVLFWASLNSIYALFAPPNGTVKRWQSKGKEYCASELSFDALQKVLSNSLDIAEVEYFQQNGEYRNLCIAREDISMLDVDEHCNFSNEFSYIVVTTDSDDKICYFQELKNAYEYVTNKYRGDFVFEFSTIYEEKLITFSGHEPIFFCVEPFVRGYNDFTLNIYRGDETIRILFSKMEVKLLP